MQSSKVASTGELVPWQFLARQDPDVPTVRSPYCCAESCINMQGAKNMQSRQINQYRHAALDNTRTVDILSRPLRREKREIRTILIEAIYSITFRKATAAVKKIAQKTQAFRLFACN